ncbi:FAD-dependent oxidoreductase [Nocardia anaemiae]|uniref:FAD-dependent oxidoreductase n=1 Tax=Nocardia anaemiae TaxID=263910 RepID=UPI000B183E1D|nr:FAD-dependent oxidoreductase [Nocardia anaemiae]
MAPSVAVIGSGVSGMTAAYLLRNKFEVTVFEADSRLGGHVDTRHPEPSWPAEMAFAIASTIHYPNFTRLVKDLGVATKPVDVSTEVSCSDCGFAHRSDDPMELASLPCRPPGVSEHVWHRCVEDSKRFVSHLREAIHAEPDTTLEQFLLKEEFSTYFAEHFVYPRLRVWLLTDLRYTPIGYLTNVLDRYGLLGGAEAFRSWYVLSEGSAAYIERIAATVTSIKTSTPVRAVSRTGDGIAIRDAAGNIHHFDKAVVALHAPQALALLTEPTAEQRSVLNAFDYTPLEAVLHTDESMLPTGSGSAGVAIQLSCTNPHLPPLTAHANMNRMRGETSSTTYWVTYDPFTPVNPASVLAREVFRHPTMTLRSAAAQRRLPALSDHVLAFAGSYHGDGFHESGCASGVAAAKALTGKDAETLFKEAVFTGSASPSVHTANRTPDRSRPKPRGRAVRLPSTGRPPIRHLRPPGLDVLHFSGRRALAAVPDAGHRAMVASVLASGLVDEMIARTADFDPPINLAQVRANVNMLTTEFEAFGVTVPAATTRDLTMMRALLVPVADDALALALDRLWVFTLNVDDVCCHDPVEAEAIMQDGMLAGQSASSSYTGYIQHMFTEVARFCDPTFLAVYKTFFYNAITGVLMEAEFTPEASDEIDSDFVRTFNGYGQFWFTSLQFIDPCLSAHRNRAFWSAALSSGEAFLSDMNDVLSFYKEAVHGEDFLVSRIYRRSVKENIPYLAAYRRSLDSGRAAYRRILDLATDEQRPHLDRYLIGYVYWHFVCRRCRWQDIYPGLPLIDIYDQSDSAPHR